MTLTACDVIAHIGTPGLTLSFCDETDLTTVATGTMAGDIHAWVGLIMSSDSHAEAAAALLSFQDQYGLPELHGNEIVTPGSKSPWVEVTPQLRRDALALACDLIDAHALSVRYVHIPKSQYAALREQNPSEPLPKKYKQAVKRVFKSCIVEHLASQAPAILIFDKDKNNPGPTLEPIAGAPHLVGNGAVRAASHMLPGLQLADIAAYVVGRYIRRRDGILAATADGFDEIAMKFVASIGGRLGSMLAPS